jgi:hypothetical protein
MTDYNRNPNGLGGFQAGQVANPGGRAKSVSQLQLYALGRCREAIDVATRVMRQPKEGDNIRLRAAEMILDRGVGRPGQAVSLDVSLTKPLEAMSVEELQQFRERYAAIVTASPALIEHVLADDEANEEQIALDLNDHSNTNDVDGALGRGGCAARGASAVTKTPRSPASSANRRRGLEMLASEITLDRIEVPVGLLRSQDQIVAEINALGAKAKQASDKADQYRATRRQNISELHKRWPDEWLQIVKEQCKIGRSEAYKQLAIADGRTTEEKERQKTAARVGASRESPLRSGPKNAEDIEQSGDDAEDTPARMASAAVGAQVAAKAAAVAKDEQDPDEAEFLAKADAAIAAAHYSGELLYESLIEKSREVIRAWQDCLIDLEREWQASDDNAQN